MAGDSIQPAPGRAETIAVAASSLFLFAAPFAGSAGIRSGGLILAALVIAIAGLWRTAHKRVPLALAATIASWFLLTALSLAWSADPQLTLEELRAESLYGFLAFAVFFTLATDARRWRVWWFALIAGTLLTLAAREFQQVTGVTLWMAPPDGGVGAFSTHLVLIAPLLVALAWNTPWGIRRSAGLLACSLLVLIVAAWTTRESWTTPNRIIWPALGAAFVAAIIAGRSAAGFPADALPGLRRVIAITGIAIVVAFVASIAAKSERFYHGDPRFAASVEHDIRPRLWTVGLERWKDAPWLGHGFGREILGSAFLPETPSGGDHPEVRHAHNAFLNIALQLGIIGLVVFVAVLAALAREYVALLAQPAAAVLGLIGLALLAGFVTKNLTDDFLHRHNAQVFWALNGMLLGFAARMRGG